MGEDGRQDQQSDHQENARSKGGDLRLGADAVLDGCNTAGAAWAGRWLVTIA